MKRETTYLFLRDELQNLAVRQDNILSMAYATVAVIWTFAISESNEWVSLLSLFIMIPLTFRICDLRYNAVFLGAYLKECLEDEDDWENMRLAYYSHFPLSTGIKIISYVSKLGLPMVNIISCLIFWILRIDDLHSFVFSFENVVIITFRCVICFLLWAVWIRFSNPALMRKNIEQNWDKLKVKYISNRKGDCYEEKN